MAVRAGIAEWRSIRGLVSTAPVIGSGLWSQVKTY